MAQDLYPSGTQGCFACIQWDGQRTYFPEKKLIKVDKGSDGTCRITHKKIRGSRVCPLFFPLR